MACCPSDGTPSGPMPRRARGRAHSLGVLSEARTTRCRTACFLSALRQASRGVASRGCSRAYPHGRAHLAGTTLGLQIVIDNSLPGERRVACWRPHWPEHPSKTRFPFEGALLCSKASLPPFWLPSCSAASITCPRCWPLWMVSKFSVGESCSRCRSRPP